MVVEQELSKAYQDLNKALHILSYTYVLSKDPGVLRAALCNIHNAHQHIITALYHILGGSQELPFQEKLQWCSQELEKKDLIETTHFHIFTQIHMLYKQHINSTVEFSRANNWVMCSPTYACKQLTSQQLLACITQTQDILTTLFKS